MLMVVGVLLFIRLSNLLKPKGAVDNCAVIGTRNPGPRTQMQVGLWMQSHYVAITGYSYSNIPVCPICAHTEKVRRKGANCGWFVIIVEIAIPKVQSKADNTKMVTPGF